MKTACFVAAFVSVCLLSGVASKVVGGYFPNWSGGLACHALQVKNFDPSPYTHIWYAFASVSQGSWMPSAGGDENPGGVMYELIALKQKHANLSVLISLGGGGQSDFFWPLASSASNRATFLGKLVPWLRKYNADGVDYDWETPTGQDAKNFDLLLQDTRAAFEKEAASSGKPRLLLSVASGGDGHGLGAWPITSMSKSLDWFNIMAYEEHGPWDKSTPTGINAPINSTDGYDLTDCIKAYLSFGVPSSKLLLGIPTFAHSWILADPSKTYVGAPGAGPAPGGQCTQTEGYLAYWEVTTMIQQGATVVWDSLSQTHYLYHGKTWVSYDDVQSFTAKGDFTKQYKLGGVFTWDIDEDDNNVLIKAAASRF